MHNTHVVMFPGLGASYPNMVTRYLDAYPADAALLRTWSSWVQLDLGGAEPAQAKDIERQRQLEIHAMNLLWWRQRQQLGIPADAALCGHSLGYYAALVAAGVIDELSSFKLIDAAFSAGWNEFSESPDELFVVTTTGHVDLDIQLRGLPVEVLSENASMQRVLCGRPGTLEKVRERLNGHLLGINRMPARVPFHSPRMAPVRLALQATITQLQLQPGALKAPLWSHISGRALTSGHEALALVPAQVDQAVRWSRLVDGLIQSGRYEFTEVGPSRVLTQLVRWISPDLDLNFVDHFRRSGPSTSTSPTAPRAHAPSSQAQPETAEVSA